MTIMMDGISINATSMQKCLPSFFAQTNLLPTMGNESLMSVESTLHPQRINIERYGPSL